MFVGGQYRKTHIDPALFGKLCKGTYHVLYVRPKPLNHGSMVQNVRTNHVPTLNLLLVVQLAKENRFHLLRKHCITESGGIPLGDI
jgi:hypothetical protein